MHSVGLLYPKKARFTPTAKGLSSGAFMGCQLSI
jgi:hypothetical protein